MPIRIRECETYKIEKNKLGKNKRIKIIPEKEFKNLGLIKFFD